MTFTDDDDNAPACACEEESLVILEVEGLRMSLQVSSAEMAWGIINRLQSIYPDPPAYMAKGGRA